MRSKVKQSTIGLITLFGRKPGDTFLTNLEDILSNNTPILHVISPITSIKSKNNNIVFHQIKIGTGTSAFSKIIATIVFQIKSTQIIIKLHSKNIHWIFYEAESFLLPMLMVKIFREYSTIVLSSSLENEAKYGSKILFMPLIISKWINCHLTNKIVVYSPCLVDLWGLKKYSYKVNIAQKHFIDFSLFNLKRNFNLRQFKVGYVGRFGNEKGVLNFVEAAYLITKKNNNLDFVLIGDGPLMPQVKELISNHKLNEKVVLNSWIPHEKLSDYLNEFKLLVIPSYTEGLPNVMLEAMACGTPVLSTPVGAVPDIIKDEVTGFIMESNAPECIAQNILRAINHSDLSQIAQNGQRMVEKEFTFNRANEKFQVVFGNC